MKKRIPHLLPALLAMCIALGMCRLTASAEESAPDGSRENPWDISAESGTGNVKAWYEGSEQSGYTLFVSGEGSMTASFRTVAPPWQSVKKNITSVEIQEGVTNVGAYAFNFCRALKSVSLPESLTEIGTCAFHSTGIKHLTIPANVQTLGRMVANATTYYEVLGNPENVNDHAFSTSLVSAPDQATAEALNAKTNVSALIVLDGGAYGETEDDLANLSYGLIAPVKDGCTFQGWYGSADFSGQRLATDRNGRTTTNINHIYYAKWTNTPEPTPSNIPDGSPSPAPSKDPDGSPSPAPSKDPDGSPSPAPSKDPDGSPSPAPSKDPDGSPSPAPSKAPDGSPSPAPSKDPDDTPAPPAPSRDPDGTPDPVPSDAPDNTPPDSSNGSDQTPGKAETPGQSDTMHSPRTGDYSKSPAVPNDTAGTQDHGISRFLLISATAAAVISGAAITVLMRRKYGGSNHEGRKNRK